MRVGNSLAAGRRAIAFFAVCYNRARNLSLEEGYMRRRALFILAAVVAVVAAIGGYYY